MGILTLGLGLGGTAVLGTLIQMLGHSLSKAGLFFVAGNILSHFRTKKIDDIHGLINGKMRWSGMLWMIGFLLITGTPPSAVFIGKFLILKEALFAGRYGISCIFLVIFAIIFIGMARIFISMTQGEPDGEKKGPASEGSSVYRIGVPAVFFFLVIALGLYVPGWLMRTLETTAKSLGGF
jgi:hydrogenase-4 component F